MKDILQKFRNNFIKNNKKKCCLNVNPPIPMTYFGQEMSKDQ